jgi:hypothetical protein
MKARALLFALVVFVCAAPALADPIFFSTGSVTNSIGMASRPSSTGKIEIEAADDFVLTGGTLITGATFTGLITGGATTANIGQVVVEMYRVFPKDSDVSRTSGPPTFSTSQVPTRVNSPSDVEFEGRESTLGELSFTTTLLSSSFTALNSVLNGINVCTTPPCGEGSITGQEVQFNVSFDKPIFLPADHYFFVPQVEITTGSGQFFWLSGSRPIDATGTPFPPGFTDLQTWMRNQNLDPDWLRVGTDIVGAGTFNAAFTLSGVPIPEPSTLTLVLIGVVGSGIIKRRTDA